MKRNKVLPILLVLIILVFLSLFLVGCSKGLNFLEPESKEDDLIKCHQVYIPTKKVNTLNPLISKDEDTYYISKLVYESLFFLDTSLAPQPLLVSTYSYDQEERKLTLKIKSGILWQNGETLTAKDAKATIEALKNLSYGNSTIYGAYVSDISWLQLDRNDPLVLYIYYNFGSFFSPEKLIFPILPYEDCKSPWEMEKNKKTFIPIGTGAYMFKEKTNSHISFYGNPNYPGKIPENTLIFHIIPDKKVAINMLDGNDISLVFDKCLTRNVAIGNVENANVLNFPSNEVEFIGFNMSNPKIASISLRIAIAYASDREQMIESAYMDNGILSTTPYYPGYLGVPDIETPYKYNVKLALNELIQAGYKDSNRDGFLEPKDGNANLELSILVNSDSQYRMAAAQILKASLDKIQLKVSIDSCEREVYDGKIRNGNYDIYIGGYKLAEYLDLRQIFHSTGENPFKLYNSVLDEDLEALAREYNLELKGKAYKKVREDLLKILPCYTIMHKTYGMVWGTSLRGNAVPMFNNLYREASKWSTVKSVVNPEVKPEGNPEVSPEAKSETEIK